MPFVHVPEGKTVKNRLHIDVRHSEPARDEELTRLLGLGATLVADHREEDGLSASFWAKIKGLPGCFATGATLHELRVLVRTLVAERKQLLDDTAALDSALEIPIRPVAADRRVEIPVRRKLLRLDEVASDSPIGDHQISPRSL